MSAAHEDMTGRARLRDADIECSSAQGFDESLRAEALPFTRNAGEHGLSVSVRDEEARVHFLSYLAATNQPPVGLAGETAPR